MAYPNENKRFSKNEITSVVGKVNESTDKTKIATAFTNVLNALKAKHL